MLLELLDEQHRCTLLGWSKGELIAQVHAFDLFAWGVADEDVVGADLLVIEGEYRQARVLGGPVLETQPRDGRTVIEVPASPTQYAIGLELIEH